MKENEIAPGLYVETYWSDDGKLVVQLYGELPNDPDCDNVRVYVNRWLRGGNRMDQRFSVRSDRVSAKALHDKAYR